MLMTVFGKRGSGKTTLIRALIPKLKTPVIVIDILGNFDPLSPEGEKWTREQPQVKAETWVQTSDHIEAMHEILLFMKDPKEHSGIIVVKDSDVNRCVDYLCSALWHKRGGTLVVDEADAIQEKEAPCFDEAIRYGRNKGIDIVTGCRRPAEISRNVTAGSDIAYCLSTQEPRDIDYYCDFLGEELALHLKELPQHTGIYRDFTSQKEGVFKTKPNGALVIVSGKSTLKSVEEVPQPTPLRAGGQKKVDAAKNASQTEGDVLSN